ncbi:hypothetical protein [Ekhidna sp.]|uniref:hypothetical protein n=1 Tax=Ekhidna sp. TaxID=2608089 RepID=UPI003B50860A
MQNKIVLLVLLYFPYLSFAQIGMPGSVERMQISELGLKTSSSNEAVFLDHPRAHILTKLGTPNSIEDYYYEMDELMAERFIYNTNYVFVSNDKLDAFELTDNSLSVSYRGKSIKVGDHYNEVSEMYVYADNYKGPNFYAIKLFHEEVEQDGKMLIVHFNSSTNLITKILLHEL